MNADTLREKANVELQDELAALRKEIFDLQFRSGSSETEERGKFVKVRRDVARVLTIMREREIGLRGQTAPES